MEFSANDLAIEHQLAWLAENVRFLLEVTPLDADEARVAFLAGEVEEPVFTYRELGVDLDVAEAALANVNLPAIEDATLRTLLEHKHNELHLQLQMLGARDTEDFPELSAQLFGRVDPELLSTARSILDRVEVPRQTSRKLDADEFLELAHAEIQRYKDLDPDIDIHAEIRPDVAGVLCAGNALIIADNAGVFEDRAEALIQHEIGTHLVTQVNGSGQRITTMGTGLAGYDETQEGLAVVAEIAVGGLTPFRLRQLAARVITVHTMLGGAPFSAAFQQLVDYGLPKRTAFTTTMRVYRAGGFTKDAIYLRGLLNLLRHVEAGGELDLFFLGKFAFEDLPLITDLNERGLLAPPRIMPPWLKDEGERRIREAAEADDLLELL